MSPRTADVEDTVASRVRNLDLPFNRDGFDPYGVSQWHLVPFLSMLGWFYRHYFRVQAHGLEHVPAQGRAMLVGNHSGGYAIDAGMVIAACFLELDPPRLAQGMADKFLNRLPFVSTWCSRTGQFTGLPEHAVRLLEDERLLMVFPEGTAGTAKLYPERHSLRPFGTGFVRLALQTQTPIVPFAFLGGGEAVPTVRNVYRFRRWLGTPYIPVTPYLVPLPLPARLSVRFGPPIELEGTGQEEDAHIQEMTEGVRARIRALMDEARQSIPAGPAP